MLSAKYGAWLLLAAAALRARAAREHMLVVSNIKGKVAKQEVEQAPRRPLVAGLGDEVCRDASVQILNEGDGDSDGGGDEASEGEVEAQSIQGSNESYDLLANSSRTGRGTLGRVLAAGERRGAGGAGLADDTLPQGDSEDLSFSDDVMNELTRLCLAAAATAVICRLSGSFERNLINANAILHQVF
mmetsp:Transcript_25242/g.78619  ORF Transcript_25242/g.78619 Transcript_25242/m.78619 type:complete len:187 (-) Transcript_25242:82-642(-)